jgi:ABC-type branched-subunit amino acid transport system substrate-binding protein
MTIAPINGVPSLPSIRTVADAAAEYHNPHGGVGGRKVQLIFCDNQGTTAGLASCAEQAVNDHVTAVVGGFFFGAAALVPALNQAGIAWLGSPGADALEYTSSNVFEMGGQLAYQAGQGWLAKEEGCKSIAVLDPDTGADAQLAIQNIKNGVKSAGGDPSSVSAILYPPTTADFTPYAAKAANADCGIPYVGSSQLPGWLSDLNAVGSKQRLVSFQGSLIASTAAKFPAYGNGALMTGTYGDWRTAPAWAPFRAALKAIGASDQTAYDGPSGGQTTWAAYMAFWNIANSIKDVNSKTFLAAASNATHVETNGLLPPLNFTKKFTGLDNKFPRYFTPYTFLFRWQNAQPKLLGGGPQNMTDVINGVPSSNVSAGT